MTKLPGSVPAKEVEEMKHEDDNAAADTPAPTADAPAAAEATEVALPEEVKIGNQKIVTEAPPALAPAPKADN